MLLKPILDTFHCYLKIINLVARLTISFSRDNTGKEKHLLLLAWFFPPKVSGGVYRPLSIVRAAMSKGWKVTVIAGPHPELISSSGAYLKSRLPTGVKIINIEPSSLKPSYRLSPRIDGGFLNTLLTIDTCCTRTFKKPTIVLSSGPPFHNFAAGAYISKYFKIPLILDYRDEWTDCPFDFVENGNIDRFVERICLRHASGIVVTTESFKLQSLKSFPEINESKYIIFPNGYEKDEVATSKTKTLKIHKDKFYISFIGTLSGHSDPLSFLDTLSNLVAERADLKSRIKISFIGSKRDDIVKRIMLHKAAPLVELIEHVSKPEAISLMRTSNALLSINPIDIHRYIPGKIFEYVASGTPIIVYGQGGEISRIIDTLGAGICIKENDSLALGRAIDIINNEKIAINNDKVSEWLAAHERNNIASNFLKYIDDTV